MLNKLKVILKTIGTPMELIEIFKYKKSYIKYSTLLLGFFGSFFAGFSTANFISLLGLPFPFDFSSLLDFKECEEPLMDSKKEDIEVVLSQDSTSENQM